MDILQFVTNEMSNILHHGELQTNLFQVANIMNSRPLGKRPDIDPSDGGPITMNHLLLGRATSERAIFFSDSNLSPAAKILRSAARRCSLDEGG